MAIFGTKDTSGSPATELPSPSPAPAGSGRVSRLGEGILVKGRVEGSETLRFDGRLEGEVDLKADLIIGPQAEVNASVHARRITVEGKVDGDLSADVRIDLVRTARVDGTIKCPSISIAEGASFEGTVDMSVRKESSR